MSRTTWIAAGATATAIAWLLLAPVPVEPVAWHAPAAPARAGVLAANDRLRGVERVGGPDVAKPEATAIDAAGRVHAGLIDGRVIRLDPGTGKASTLAATGGRPLGLAFDAEGRLYVCDAVKGLLRISTSGEVTTLATGQAASSPSTREPARSPCSSRGSSSRTASRCPATAATSSWPRREATGSCGTGSPGRGAGPPSPSWRTCPASPTT